MLNKSKGNMYPWVTHTWNPIKGKCPHDCDYCYYQNNPRFKSKIKKLRLDEKCFKDNLGKDNFIFVGSSTDMFADLVSEEWIFRVLNYCNRFGSRELFQTKNPKRFLALRCSLPYDALLGITMETDRVTKSKAPTPFERIVAFSDEKLNYFEKMVSIEPIMDFDENALVTWIKQVPNLKFVSIGADSKGSKIPEPSSEKVHRLIDELSNFMTVKVKGNLKRVLEKRDAHEKI